MKFAWSVFLDSSEALAAKREAEIGQSQMIGSLNDLDDWIDKLDAIKRTKSFERELKN